MSEVDRLIALLIACMGLLTVALIVIYSVFGVPTIAARIVPTQMICIDGNAHYKPADGRNYIVMNDLRCKG